MVQKKIIIVGASSGIGREIATRYAEQGHRVGITGRREHLLNELKEKFPQQILVSAFDVMGTENKKKIRQLMEDLDGLDLLIYNSGYGEPSKELNPEVEELTTRTNVSGFVEIVSDAFNYFVEKDHGQIAITSSIAGVRGNSWAPSYSASKAYMSRYAESLNLKARRLKKNILITDIRPGFVDANMAKGKVFWLTPLDKAVKQIIKAIEKKKRVAYISRRWWIVAKLMKWMPYWIYKRIV